MACRYPKKTWPQQTLRPLDDAKRGAYWPVLGLVAGPEFVIGVGLVVVGVSVPVPPMLEPLLDAPPELLGEPMLPDVPEVPEVPVEPLVPEVPDGVPDVP